MLRPIKNIEGYTVRATDGDVGKVRSFYFDSHDWVVRYMVVELDERIVLLSPVVLGEPDPQEKVMHVHLTTDKVRNSPDWNTDRPVSRQHETDLYNYYGWPYYWDPGTITGGLASVPAANLMADYESQARQDKLEKPEDPDLHSTREVLGYHIEARDGGIGRIEDFIIEDENWHIMYMVANTGGFLTGHNVIIAPSWIREVSWADKQVHVDLERETIRNSPEYDPQNLIDREYENSLYEHYRRDKYW
jgi:hypothetical protein